MFSEECKNLEQFLKDTCGPSFILITDPYLYNQSFMGVRLIQVLKVMVLCVQSLHLFISQPCTTSSKSNWSSSVFVWSGVGFYATLRSYSHTQIVIQNWVTWPLLLLRRLQEGAWHFQCCCGNNNSPAELKGRRVTTG